MTDAPALDASELGPSRDPRTRDPRTRDPRTRDRSAMLRKPRPRRHFARIVALAATLSVIALARPADAARPGSLASPFSSSTSVTVGTMLPRSAQSLAYSYSPLRPASALRSMLYEIRLLSHQSSVDSTAESLLLIGARKAAYSQQWAQAAQLAAYAANSRREYSWQAALMAGYAYRELGDFDVALHALEASLESMPENAALRPHAQYWTASVALESGRPVKTLFYGAQVAEERLPVELRSDLEMLRARASVQLCRSNSDLQSMRHALDTHPAYPLAATARTEIAGCLATLGRPDLAMNELEALHRETPWLPVVQHALLAFEASTGEHVRAYTSMTTDEHLAWLRDLRFSRNWTLAEQEFAVFLQVRKSAQLSPAQRNGFWFQRGLNAYESGAFARAIAYFAEVDQARGGFDPWLLAKFESLSLSRMGQTDAAYQRIREGCGANPQQRCADLLWEFAWDYGLYDTAAEALETSREVRIDPLQRALLSFARKDYQSAVTQLRARRDQTSGHDRLQATYWLARAHQMLDEPEHAHALFAEVIGERPFDYYALLARGQLLAMEASKGGDAPQGAALPDGFSLAWLPSGPARDEAGYPSIATTEILAPLSHFASRWSHLFPEAKQAVLLAEIGALEEARLLLRPAFREIEWRKQTSPDNRAALPFSPYQYRIDNRREGRTGWLGIAPHAVAATLVSANGRSAAELAELAASFDMILDDATAAADAVSDCFMVRQFVDVDGRLLGPTDDAQARARWARFYCRPFPARTHALSVRYGVPQELLWALILAESSGNPDSISHAHAYGLMQVIGRTGIRIALGYGAEDFGIHELLDPRESLKFGSWYLAQLLERFRGQEPLALVAYNAGPHQVARWLDWRGDKLPGDLFFETIPYGNSKNYAKKILRLAATYRYLEDDSSEAFLGPAFIHEDGDNIYY